MRSRCARVAAVAAVVAATTVTGLGVASSAPANAVCDTDGDGHSDVLVGAPGADGDTAAEADAGAVVIIPGGPDGPEAAAATRITQDVAGVPDRNERGDGFGAATACADVDADGYDDVAIGAPWEGVSGRNNAGAVHVFYGSPNGIGGDRNERWTLNKPGLLGASTEGAMFGATLAFGDFDGDGRADLAAAAPGNSSVHVLYGGNNGVTSRDDRIRAGTINLASTDFGGALATGDIDADGRDELVIGAPGAGISGAVVIIWGDADAMTTDNARVVDFDIPGIKGIGKAGAGLGTAVAVGDFDADGKDDVAVGAPGYRRSGNDGAGLALVVFGSKNRAGTRDMLVESSAPVPRAGFGWSLSSGDFNGDGITDLAAGAPTDDGAAPYAGRVEVLLGDGITPLEGAEVLLGTDLGGGFGSGLRFGDVDGDALDDLWIAAPHATAGGLEDAGAFIFAPGGTTDTTRFDRTTPGIAGPPQSGEGFGSIDGTAHVVDHPGTFVTIAPRAEWTIREPVTSRMAPHTISRITVHHGGGNTTPVGAARFQSWQGWHMDGQGWGDVAYHYIVGKDGRVYAARDPQWAGDTGTNYEPAGHLLIVVEGNFNKETPSQTQLDTLATVVAWAADEWGVPLEAVAAHRDHASTTCPGLSLYPYIASGDLGAAAQRLLDDGGVWAVPHRNR